MRPAKPKPPPPEKTLRQVRPNRKTLSEILAQFTPEWQDRVISYAAENGDFRPLSDALLHGDELGPLTRAFLIRDFSGEAPRKRGNKRTFEQLSRDVVIWFKVVCAMVDHQMSKTAAIDFVAGELNKPVETVRSIFARVAPSLEGVVLKDAAGRLHFAFEMQSDLDRM